MNSEKPDLLEVQNLQKHYPLPTPFFQPRAFLRAVEGVSFSIGRGRTLGLVGESGCGKSTLGRTVLKLVEPTSGKIFFAGKNITFASGAAMKPFRKRMQMIFQDPYSSLNPRMMVGAILEEPMVIHDLYGAAANRRAEVKKLLHLVGLPQLALTRYPHEFSGGQRQRIGIARALAVQPEFVVCDEPVSALDVSIQAQILNLLLDLQEKLALTYLFISHDLRVVEHVSHDLAVMYLGKIVETGPAKEICSNPRHPYTQALLSAVLSPNANFRRRRIILAGEPPESRGLASGCPFAPRCFKSEARCRLEAPPLLPTGDQGIKVACWLAEGSKGA